MKICIILGTRPEIIKMSPIIRECRRRRLNYFVIHTKQHYSIHLDGVFFQELGLPMPEYNLNVGSGTHATQTARMLVGIEQVLMSERPNIVLVEGDTNSVLAGALAAAKLNIKIGHVEAGLRSYFREMPEETNRVLVDHCSDLLFAPTPEAGNILRKEGIPAGRIKVTGNTIVDAVNQNLFLARKKSKVLEKFGLEKDGYFFVTLHRAENVDDRQRLTGILHALDEVQTRHGMPLIFPVHPRTRSRMKGVSWRPGAGVRLLRPLGYFDALCLLADAHLILTDSGGVQEEACVLRVPCVTLRDNTERPETVAVGANMLAGANPRRIMKAVGVMLKRRRSWRNPIGKGDTAERIMHVVTRRTRSC